MYNTSLVLLSKHNKCSHCFQRLFGNAAVKDNYSEIAYTRMTDANQAFQKDQNNISDAVQRDQSTS